MALPGMKTDVSNIPTALYLQGGPGLNSAVERAWFGDSHPILWWDQPRFPADGKNAYQATLDAAAEKLAELHGVQGKPIHVIAWSFGARLALDLAHHTPEMISALTLLAPSFCLGTAFDRMSTYLASKGLSDSAHLRPRRSPEDRSENHDDFMQRVMTILSIPDLFSHYWAPTSTSQFDRHRAEAARTEWFDLPTFTAVSREIIQLEAIPLPVENVSSVSILAGRHDPYFVPEADFILWKKFFPEATIRTVDSAHMLPFEISATEWLA